jgi:hypothetical protein
MKLLRLKAGHLVKPLFLQEIQPGINQTETCAQTTSAFWVILENVFYSAASPAELRP